MKEAFEKIKDRLKRYSFDTYGEIASCKSIWLDRAIAIVNQVAEEYNDGWIPFDEEHLPPITGVYLVSYGEDQPVYIEEFNGNWFSEIHAYRQPNAWRELPPAYKPKGEK